MSTKEFSPIMQVDGQSIWQFWYKDKEYIIYFWLDDDGLSNWSLCLAEPRKRLDHTYYAHNLISTMAADTIIDKSGGIVPFIKNKFLPKVNDYLKNEHGGEGVEPDTFPFDESYVVQGNWLIKNSFELSNGEVILNQ